MKNKNAFTLIELLVVMAIIALLLGLLLPALTKARNTARQVKDATQIKQVHTGWATKGSENKDGRFPLPGEINRIGNMPGRGDEDEQKNSHANLYAACIAQNFISPQILVSPSDTSGRVTICSNYDFSQHKPAEDKYWDGDLTNKDASNSGGKGHFTTDLKNICNTSYGSLPLVNRDSTSKVSNRRDIQWKAGAPNGSKFPIIANRGVKDGKMDGTDEYGYANSETLKIHGALNQWEGNVCYNDGHVAFGTTFWPEGMNCVPGGVTDSKSCPTKATDTTKMGLDNLFKDDDTSGHTDSYLCIVKQLSKNATGNTIVDEATNWD